MYKEASEYIEYVNNFPTMELVLIGIVIISSIVFGLLGSIVKAYIELKEED